MRSTPTPRVVPFTTPSPSVANSIKSDANLLDAFNALSLFLQNGAVLAGASHATKIHAVLESLRRRELGCHRVTGCVADCQSLIAVYSEYVDTTLHVP